MGSRDTVNPAVADDWVIAVPIHDKVHPAKDDVDKVDVKSTADGDETSRQSVYICKFDCLSYFIESVIWNKEQVTEVLHLLHFIGGAHKETLEESNHTSGFDTSDVILTVTLCAYSATMKNSSVVCGGVWFLKDVVTESLVDRRHRFAALSALYAAGTLCPCEKKDQHMFLVLKRDVNAVSCRKIILYNRSATTMQSLCCRIIVS